MDNTSTIALSRLTAQQRALDVTATNLANAETPGFKAKRVLFTDWLARQHDTTAPHGGKVNAYTQDRATYADRRDGSLTITGNPLDLAITGDGFFTVDTANGPRLTRAGRFGLLPDGAIADGSGNRLLDVNGQPLRVAAADTKLSVAPDGTLTSENGQIGKIGVVQPADAMRLRDEGGTLNRVESTTAAVAQPRIAQGALERSNVQPVLETARMMSDLREFQFTSEMVRTEAERHQNAIDKILGTRR